MVASAPALLPGRSTSPVAGPSRWLRTLLPSSSSADTLQAKILSSLSFRGRGLLSCGGRILVAAVLLLLLWVTCVPVSQPGLTLPSAVFSIEAGSAGDDAMGSGGPEDVGVAVQASGGSGGGSLRFGDSLAATLRLDEEAFGVFQKQAEASGVQLASLAPPREALSAVVVGAVRLAEQVLLLLQLPQQCIAGTQGQEACPGVVEAVAGAQCHFGCREEEQTSEVLGASLAEHGRLYVRCRAPRGWYLDTELMVSLVLGPSAERGAGSMGPSGNRSGSGEGKGVGGEDGVDIGRRQALQVNCSGPELPAACSCVSPFLPLLLGSEDSGLGSSRGGGDEAECPPSAEGVLSALLREVKPAKPGLRLASCARLVVQPHDSHLQLVVDAVLQRRGLYVFVKGLTWGLPLRTKHAQKRAPGVLNGLASFFGGLLGAAGASDPSDSGEGQEGGGAPVLNVTCEFGRNCSVPAISGALEVILCPTPPVECLNQGRVGSVGSEARTGEGGSTAVLPGSGGQLRVPVSLRDGRGVLFPSLASVPEGPTFPTGWGTGEGELNYIPTEASEHQGTGGSEDVEGAATGGKAKLHQVVPAGVSKEVRALTGSDGPQKEFYVCSCTMVFNMAKFLKEWLVYHHWMGVERFFLYDNLSSDNLTESVKWFSAWVAAHPDFFPKAPHGTSEKGTGATGAGDHAGERVSVHLWPWLKSQQSGFSHCLLRAASQCTWVLFTDVDEFLRPRLIDKLATREAVADAVVSRGPMLHQLMATVRKKAAGELQRRGEKLGQICFNCLEFGASGHTEHPKEGVSAGYTCRRTRPQRHKCLVRPEAADDSLFTRVHDFDMRPGFQSNLILAHGKERAGWINHYKFQAWSEFRAKFVRRVATNVKDWNDPSQIRRKGLNRDKDSSLVDADAEHMPANWSMRFCDINDTAVSRFVHLVFAANVSVPGLEGTGQTLVW